MAFGILEDHNLSDVPGTGPLSTKADRALSNETGELKRGTGKFSHIVLLPQPSDDPCDPLNWPRWKKEACFWTIMFTSAALETISTLPTASYVLFSLGSAICVLFQNPLSIKYGHRIMYIICTLLMFISCIWSPLSTSLASISASRVLQGVAWAPIQCLVPVTIEHMYFVHERGSRVSILSLFQTCAPILAVTINSYVIQRLSWKLGFWFASIPCGLCFLGAIFFVPETIYHRQSSERGSRGRRKYESAKETTTSNVNAHPVQPPKLPTLLSQVKIYNGTFSNESMWKIFLRPFPFLLSPVTWFVFISSSMQLVCLGLVELCIATIYTITYHFNAEEIGLTNVANFVAVIPAVIVAGPLNDRWIIWMSQRNGGVYEPEFRLLFIQSMLFFVFGLVGWAIGFEHHMPWIGAVGCSVMMVFGAFVSTMAVQTYLIDTHGTNSFYVLTLNGFAKSMITYAMTFFANGLVLSAGVKVFLLAIAALLTCLWLSWIPMYVYGKRARSFIARHPRLFRRDLPGPVADSDSNDSPLSMPPLRPGPASSNDSESKASESTSGSGDKGHGSSPMGRKAYA